MAEEGIVERVEELAREHGFSCIGRTTADKLKVREEVRNMCAADKCHSYGRNWSCPPACGTIDEYRDRIAGYSDVVVFQTVAEMEDEFDLDTMMDAAESHGERVPQLVESVREVLDDFLALGAGACSVCDECAYPDEPCRFPDKRVVSMEASGLVVSDVCTAAGIPYNHGSDHVAYTSCIVF